MKPHQTWHVSDNGAIERAYVDEGYRGHGCQSALCLHLQTEARSLGCHQARTAMSLRHRNRDRTPQDRRPPQSLLSDSCTSSWALLAAYRPLKIVCVDHYALIEVQNTLSAIIRSGGTRLLKRFRASEAIRIGLCLRATYRKSCHCQPRPK
jgi:hypothetical protein